MVWGVQQILDDHRDPRIDPQVGRLDGRVPGREDELVTVDGVSGRYGMRPTVGAQAREDGWSISLAQEAPRLLVGHPVHGRGPPCALDDPAIVLGRASRSRFASALALQLDRERRPDATRWPSDHWTS